MKKIFTLFAFAVFCFVKGWGQVPNDNCSAAAELTCNSSYSGNNTNAVTEPLPAPACDDPNDAPGASAYRGVWFVYHAQVAGTVTFSTVGGASWDTYLRVYSGSCSALSCQGGNDDFAGTQSSVIINAVPGTAYYILLSGYGNGDFGAYTLNTTCTVPNDNCATAIALACNGSYTGNNTFATDDALPASSCGDAQYTSKGIWFTYTAATAGLATFSLAGDENANANFYIRVYSGTCDSLSCVNYSRYSGLSVEAYVKAGTTYYILLTSSGYSLGTYTINATCKPQTAVPNDSCASAIPLTCGGSYSGDNTFATDDVLPASTCGDTTRYNTKGVWFTYTAEQSGATTFSTYNDGTGFDTYLRAYTGSCNALTCTGFNQDTLFRNGGGTYKASLTINAVAGTTYYILLSGSGISTHGNYTLNTYCPLVNDNCIGALALTANSSYTGNNSRATDDTLPSSTCGSTAATTAYKGIWFTYTATKNSLTTFSTVSETTNFDTYLKVYSGSCGALSCVGYNDDSTFRTGTTHQSSLTLSTTAGTTYYILLTGVGTRPSGDYTLTTYCRAANDTCTAATEVTCGNTYAGSTADATDETINYDPNNPANTCGYVTAGKYRGVWFHYRPATNSAVTFATTTQWLAFVRVYSGSCGALTCAGNQLSAFSTSDNKNHTAITIAVAANTDYYILLAGFAQNNYGDYTLMANCVCAATIVTQPVAATYCQNAAAAPLSVKTTGYTSSYKWLVNTINSKTGGTVVGSDSIYIPPTAATGTRYYYAVVTGGCNADTSAIASVAVGAPLTAALSAQQTQVCYGSQILLTASAQGSSKSYTYNFINIDSNSSTGYTSNKSKSEPVGSYVVAIKNSGGCIDTSDVVTITQPASPIAITTTLTAGICGGNGKVMVSATGGYGGFIYTINTDTTVGKITPYTFGNLPQGKYTITAIDAHGCALSKTVTVGNTTKVPAIIGFTGPTTVLNSSITTYHVDSAYNVSYAWTVPSDAVVVSGQGTATASIKWGYKSGKIKITPSSSCGTGTAKQYSITVTHANSFQSNVITNAVVTQESSLSVYPNPTRNVATLQFSSTGEAKYVVDVTDLHGRQILHKEGTAMRGVNQVKLDLRNVTNGVYLIRVSDGKTAQNIKLMKGD